MSNPLIPPWALNPQGAAAWGDPKNYTIPPHLTAEMQAALAGLDPNNPAIRALQSGGPTVSLPPLGGPRMPSFRTSGNDLGSRLHPEYMARRLEGTMSIPRGESVTTQPGMEGYYGMDQPWIPRVDPTNPAIQALARPPGSSGPSLLAQGADAYGQSIRNFAQGAQDVYRNAQEGLASTSPVPTIASNPGVALGQEARQGLSLPSFGKPKVLEEMEAVGVALNPPIDQSIDGQALGQVARAVAGAVTPESLALIPGLPSKEVLARDLGYTLAGGPLNKAAETIGYMEEEGRYLAQEALRQLGQTSIGKSFKEGFYGPAPTFDGLVSGASSVQTPSEAEVAQAQAKAQEQDLASSVVGLGGGGGGGVNPNIVGSGGGFGNLYGLEEPKPLPRPDFSRIDELLAQMQPTPPEKTSREDMLLAVLGGLAQGSLAGNTAGAALAGAGAGGIGARDQMLQRERFDQKEFEKETRDFFLQQAQQEMNELQMNGQLDLQDAAARRDFINQRASILQQQEALRIQVQLHNSSQAGANARAVLAAKSRAIGAGLKGTIPFGKEYLPAGLAFDADPVRAAAAVGSVMRGNPAGVAVGQYVNELLAQNDRARMFIDDPRGRAVLNDEVAQLAFTLAQGAGTDPDATALYNGQLTPAMQSRIQSYVNSRFGGE